jgi:hypothetical protein
MANLGPYGTYVANIGQEPTPTIPGFLDIPAIVAGNPTTLGFTALPNTTALDSIGLVLYFTSDGVTWTAITSGGGGGGSGSVVALAAGNPNGVTTATGPAIGVTPNGGVWFKPSGGGNTGWLNLIADGP